MAGLTLKVHTGDAEKAIAKALAKTANVAEEAVAVQVLKDTSPFVPATNGKLDQSSKAEGNLVIYPGPYARYLYYGKLMVDPDTGSSWASSGATKVLTDRDLVFNTSMHAQAQSHWFEASKAQNMNKWERVAAKAVKMYGK